MPQKLEQLEEKIKKAVPVKIICDNCNGSGKIGFDECRECDGKGKWDDKFRDIGLEDVLVAWNKKLNEVWGGNYGMKNKGMSTQIQELITDYWQLNKPLHLQSTETITFLHKILCKEEGI